jgi:biotin operon repressor
VKTRLTHLQRAYKVFEQMQPQLLSGRTLAALMTISVKTAYNYIDRLKKGNCIEAKGGSGKVPQYALKEGATMPAGDTRGRKAKPRRVLEPDFGSPYQESCEPLPMFARGTGTGG